MALAVPVQDSGSESTPKPTLMGRLASSWYAAVPALLAVVIGMRGISSVGLWVDEFYTLNAVKGGFGSDLGELPYLPYYTVVWLMSGGGQCLTETCLRYPSVLAMSGAVLLAAVTARRLSTPRAGFAAGILVLLAPGVQRYAQDARPYALGTLLVTLATYALVLAVQSGRVWPWALYAASIIGVGLVLPVGLAVLPAHAVLMWGRPIWRPEVRRWIWSLVACVPVFALGAWAVVQFAFLKERVGDIMVIHPQNALEGAIWITSGGASTAALAGAFGMAVVILALCSRIGALWLLSVAVGVLTIWLVSVGPMLWWQGRSLIPLVGLVAVGAGVTLGEASLRRYIAALAVIAIAVAPFYTWNRLPWSRGYDYRAAAEVISRDWQSGDRIDTGDLVLPWVVQWSLEYYGTDAVRFQQEPSPQGRAWVFDGNVDCNAVETWDLGIGNTLRLCAP